MEGKIEEKKEIDSGILGDLRNIFPLVYLEPTELDNLFAKGQCLYFKISKGYRMNQLLEDQKRSQIIKIENFDSRTLPERQNLSCFLLWEGKIKCSKKDDPNKEANSIFKIDSSNLYALDGPIFGYHTFEYEALDTTKIIVIPYTKLQETMKKNNAFNFQVAIKILQKEGVLAPIIQFKNFLKNCTNEEEVKIDTLMKLYKKVAPLNHPYVNFEKRIDFKAWAMALKNLPEVLPFMTDIFLYLKLPELYKNFVDGEDNKLNETPDSKCIKLFDKTKNNKSFINNSSFKLFSRKLELDFIKKVDCTSKYFVILRDFDTDLGGFIGNICIHLIESKKFISLMRGHETFHQLSICKTLSDLVEFFKAIKMSKEEIEDFKEACFFDPKSVDNKQEVKSIVEFFSACFMQYAQIHISLKLPSSFIKPSNLNLLINSIGNVLSKYPSKKVHLMICSRRSLGRVFNSSILEYGKSYLELNKGHLNNMNEYLKNGNEIDQYCYAYGEYLEGKAHISFNQAGGKLGFYPIKYKGYGNEFHSTLVNLEEINPKLIDTIVSSFINESNKNDLILSVNYFFGHLAIEAINNLCLLLGKRLKSFGFIGQADSIHLNGQNDTTTPKKVILADKFFHDETSDTAPVNFSSPIGPSLLNMQGQNEKKPINLSSFMNQHTALLSNFEVGSILTAGADSMRNKNLYSVYSQLFNCKGVETEGFYIARELKRMRDEAIIDEFKKISFVYIIHDSPGEKIYLRGNEKIYNCGHPLQNSVYRSVISYLIS